MKILHIIPSLGLGGTEKILHHICTSRELKKQGISHVVLSLKGGGVTEQRIKNWGDKTIEVELLKSPEGLLGGIINFPYIYFQLRKKIQKIKPDIVHTWLSRANGMGRVACKDLNVKVISSLRVMEQEKYYHLFVERWTSKWAHVITVNSKSLEEFAIQKIKISKEKIKLIPNGIATDITANINVVHSLKQRYPFLNGLAVGTVCRLHYQKGVDIFLNAAKIVLQKCPEVKFLIAGDGPEKKNLERIADKLKITRSVEFCGWVPESFEFISLLKIFVLTSRWEGCSNVVLEAMSMQTPEDRTPVVATNIGGIKDLIENEKEGLLISPESSDECAAAILRLIDDIGLRNSLTLNALYKVKREYSMETMIKAYQNLYQSL